MRPATPNEIDYLGDIEGATAENPSLIRELARRLDALRRFDQSFFDTKSHPRAHTSHWPPDLPSKPS
jgi:hypothetical protein